MTQEKLLKALKEVIYPNFDKDIVTFGFVTSTNIHGNHASIKVTIPSSNDEIVTQVQKDIIEKTKHLGLKIELEIITPNIAKTQNERQINNMLPSVKHVVMISSGKGGVGKSTTSVNLAIALGKSGKNVGLLDCDIYGPNIPRMLGVDEVQPKVTPDGKKLIPIEKYGLKMISMGVLYEKGQSLIWRGPVVMRAITQLLQDVLWGELDILVIDMPPGTGDAQLTLAQSVPVSAGIAVTTPQAVALDDSARSLDMFNKLHIPIAGIIENMSGFICPKCDERYDIFGKGTSVELANIHKCEVLAEIPIEMAVREGGDNGKPIVFFEPISASAKEYLKAASKLSEFLDKVGDRVDNSQIQPIK
ncbi:sodium:proton antiporter [Helicobacter didelphidarum]|uniref:Iron-sulfur cluster carrier protein n=1 Tax=Helicobacter didelphidarum TaxID=2040648 RepID=A0A3D8IQ80_9HELI|nr:Mrp/NBP35 family ATP-binding protein [Helicobacter didelphidarum]RDU67075.1 sodium:proton antiporter [Helicobacter didelphidarum]